MKYNEIQASDNELRVILEVGYVLREAGRFDESETVFRGMMEAAPESDVPHVALGTVKLQQGRFAEAEAIYNEVLRKNPYSLYARVHRAEALLFQHKRDEAEIELKDILAIDPNSTHSHLAQSLLDAADMISARKKDVY
jgi:predicted Zn-dependent protease